MPRLVSRAELARLAGVSGAAVTKACKGQLAAACEGKRVDIDHEAVRRYLEGKGAAPPSAEPASPSDAGDHGFGPEAPPSSPVRSKAQRRRPAPETSEPPAARFVTSIDQLDQSDIDRMEDLTLREITDRFGTVTAFKDWLDARKKLSDIREKDLKNEEAEGQLIARDLVEHHVFGAIENANRQLLADAPKTIARRLYAMARSGATMEEAERVVRDIISSQLRPVKATAARVLRNA